MSITPPFRKRWKSYEKFLKLEVFSLRLPDQRALRQGCASSHPKAGSCWGGHPRWHGWHGAVFELHPERLEPKNHPFFGNGEKNHLPPTSISSIFGFKMRNFRTFVFESLVFGLVTFFGGRAFFSQISIQTKKNKWNFLAPTLIEPISDT